MATKGKSGRVIPLNKELKTALLELQKRADPSPLRHHNGTFRAVFAGRYRQSICSTSPPEELT
jgi:hypothetical protein